MTKRYYRNEEDGSIYDRETQKTIEPVIERHTSDGYEIKDGYDQWHQIEREDIEERR